MQTETKNKHYHQLIPGKQLEGDWCNFPIPNNIEVGTNTLIDTSFCFKQYFSKLPLGLRLGNNVTINSSILAAEENGFIEIGDYCFISNASIAAYTRIIIGNYVFIAGGVNIVDSDFHPMDPAERLADTIAISPIGDKKHRPSFNAKPVFIDDDVWIGFNATILKGVTIGKGCIIQPGAVVLKNIPAGSIAAGNPAEVIGKTDE